MKTKTTWTRRVLALCMSVLMLMTAWVFVAPTASAADLTISTAAQLKTFLQNVAGGNSYNGKTVELSADIDLSGQNMNGVQNNADHPFSGTFDGKGHTIKNFTLTGSAQYNGLFRYVSGTGVVIRNLNMDNVNVNVSADDIAAVAGYVSGTLTMNNVHVRSGSVSGSSHVGGLIGQYREMSSGALNMNDCSNAASISGRYSGGLVGYSESKVGETFIRCYNVGSVTSNNSGTAGGLFGYFVGTKESGIGSSTADWVWFQQCWNGGTVSGGNYDGGIIGYITESGNSEFDQCFNWGNVSSGYMSGGIFSGIGNDSVGSSYGGYFNNLYNTGSISAGSGYAYDIGWSSTTSYSGSYNCGTISSSNNRAQATQWSASQMQNGAATISSAQLVNNTWGVKIGSTTYKYPIHTWYRNLFTFESKFVDTESGTNQTITKTYNNSFTTPNPSRTGYNRNGNWTGASGQLAPGGSYTAGVTAPMNAYVVTEGASGPVSSVTYDLAWTPINYTIGYTLNGGAVSPANPTSYTIESAAITLNNPTRTGYTFKGWSGTGLSGDANTGVTIPNGSTGDRSYTANWTTDDYTITYDLDGGTVAIPNPSTYTVETNDITLNNPTKTGYTFAGWTGSNGATPQTSVSIPGGSTGDKNYTANWTPIPYTVRFVDEDGTELSSATYDYGTVAAEIVKPSNPTKQGDVQYTYTFSGWTPAIADVTGDATYTATYTSSLKKYTVTWKNWDGTVLTTSEVAYGATPEYPGTTPTRQNTAQYTYSFLGWDPMIAAVSGPATYTAQFDFTVNKYTVTFKDQNGTIIGTPQEVEYGGNATAPAPLDDYSDETNHYTFDGWSGYTDIQEDTIITATFTSAAHVFDQQNTDAKYLKSGATCTNKAVYYYSCSCGYKGTETFESGEKLAHSFTNYVSNKDATCTADGTETAVCDYGCGETDTRTAEGTKLPHSFTVLQSDATDHWYKCANCDATTEKEAHKGGTASCTEKAKCEVCDTAYGELLEHDFSVLKSDATDHWYKCANCDATTEKEAHKGGTASCTEKAICEVCDAEYGELADHDFSVLQSDATDHWYKCANCDATTQKEAHKGGTASCTEKAICEVCDTAYGDLLDHDFSVLKSDATDHWYQCANCDATTEKEAHKGGTATCTEKAICSVCDTAYGDLLDHDYSVLQSDATDHWYKCANCDATTEKEAHKGGTASCTEKAKCEVCDTAYGDLLDHDFTVLQSDADGHWYKCANCDATTEKEAHKGGTASCTEKAICEVCDTAYGDLLEHDFSVLKSDATDHWYQCANCDATTAKEAHTGGTATCTEKAKCEVCDTAYGDLLDHDFTVLQSDATDHWYKCANCDATTEKEAHKGGTATCTEKAKCSVCDTAYGDLLDHDFTVLQSDATDHWYKCANCDATTEKEAHKGGTATCTEKATCSVCSTVYGNFDYTNHSTTETTLKNAKEPGYTFKGYTGDIYCATCDHLKETGTEIDKLNLADNETVKSANEILAAEEAAPGTYDAEKIAALQQALADMEMLADGTDEDAVRNQIADIGEMLETIAPEVYVTVTFTVDGVTVSTQTIKVGTDATAPEQAAYVIDGDSHKVFSGWTGDYTNVTADVIVTATYTTQAHTWADGDVIKAATCMATGTRMQTCVCGATNEKTLDIDPANHTGNTTTTRENEVPATCTAAGSYDEVVTCECGAVLSREAKTIAQKQHSFTAYVFDNNAGCTRDGTETAACDYGCGATDTRTKAGSALGHDWGEWVVTKEATCTETGSKTRTCTRDGAHTETVTTPMLDHSDANGDTLCDDCGAPMPNHQHTDNDHDNVCDACGRTIDTGFRCSWCNKNDRVQAGSDPEIYKLVYRIIHFFVHMVQSIKFFAHK